MWLLKARRASKRVHQKGLGLLTTSLYPRETDFRLLAYRTVKRINVGFFSSSQVCGDLRSNDRKLIQGLNVSASCALNWLFWEAFYNFWEGSWIIEYHLPKMVNLLTLFWLSFSSCLPTLPPSFLSWRPNKPSTLKSLSKMLHLREVDRVDPEVS